VRILASLSVVTLCILGVACKKDDTQPPVTAQGQVPPGQYPQGQMPPGYPAQPGYPQQQPYAQQPAGAPPGYPAQAPPPGYPQQQLPPGAAAPPGAVAPGAAPGAPAGGTMATPGPLALPCQNDQSCGLAHCNTQFGKCAFPCQSAADCIQGASCNAMTGFCLPGGG
jgi:hypothetical protein